MALTDADIERIVHAILVKPAFDKGPQVSQVLKNVEEQNVFRDGVDKVRTAGLGYLAIQDLKAQIDSLSAQIKAIPAGNGGGTVVNQIDPAALAAQILDQLGLKRKDA